MEIPAVLTVKLKPIFKRLQLLDLDEVDIVEGDQALFAELDSLVELKVRHVYHDSAILENIFVKLERFSYWPANEFLDDHPLLTFISRHRSLKKLYVDIVDMDDDDNVFSTFLQEIGNSCKELEELKLYIGNTKASSLQPIEALQSLKTLKLLWVSCDDLKFIASLTKLRELHLDECVLPKDSNQFAPLAQLTKLHIDIESTPGPVDVVDIIRRLTSLEELTISDQSFARSLDEKTYSQIVNVVKGRPNILTLKCEFHFVWKICDKNQKVRLLQLPHDD